MYHREYPITPSQQATTGALAIFVEGCRLDDIAQQLFGLTVLRSATEAQIHAALPAVQATHHVSQAEIMALLSR